MEEDGQTDENAKFHFFWKSGSPFSQWHASRYVLDGVQYVNAEQGMMHGKALLFEDPDTAELIMEASSPGEMKKLGRLVKGFNDKVWKKNRVDIVYRNSVAKFTQNKHLLQALMNTEPGSLLVEASPSDRIWGIGLHERDARKIPPSRWHGLNLLGQILTRVRDEISSGMHDQAIAEAKAAGEAEE